MNDETKLVAADVKDNPIISNKIDRIAKPAFDVSGSFPYLFADDSKPRPQRNFRSGMA